MTSHSGEHGEKHGGAVQTYLMVWLILLFLTVVEVFLAYQQLALLVLLFTLLSLSFVKAGMIVAYFMHLKFERRSLALALIPMLIICILLLFSFFPDSLRLLKMRV